MELKGTMTVTAMLLVALTATAALAAGTPAEKVEVALAEGNIAFNNGDLDKALSSFEAALAGDPDNIEARYYLGLITFKKGLYSKTVEHLGAFVKAEPSNATARLHLGMAHFRQGDLDAALEQLNAADEAAPSAQAKFYLGLALLKKGDAKGAAARIDEAVKLDPALASGAEYLKAVALINEGKVDDGLSILKKLADADPKSPVGVAAGDILKGPREAGGQRRLNASAALGFLYDSNVILQASTSDVPLPAGISNEGDTRTWFSGTLGYRLLDSREAGLDVSYRIYEGINSQLHQYNFHTHDFTLGFDTESGIFSVRVPYVFTYTFITDKYSGYAFAHSLAPALTVKQGRLAAFRLGYEIRYETFLEKVIAPWWDRTGTDHKISLTEFVKVVPSLSLGAGYAWEYNDPDGRAWRYQGHHGTLLAAWEIWRGVRFDAALGYSFRGFDSALSDPMSAAEGTAAPDLTARRDHLFGVSAALAVPLAKNWLDLGFNYSGLFNRSNARDTMYDWNRHIAGLSVQASY